MTVTATQAAPSRSQSYERLPRLAVLSVGLLTTLTAIPHNVEQSPRPPLPCPCHCNAEPIHRPDVEGWSAPPTAHSDQATSKVQQPGHASEPFQVPFCVQVSSGSLTVHTFPFDNTPCSIDTQDQCSSSIAEDPTQNPAEAWRPYPVPTSARRPAQVGTGSQRLHIYSFACEARTAGQIYEEGSYPLTLFHALTNVIQPHTPTPAGPGARSSQDPARTPRLDGRQLRGRHERRRPVPRP